MSEIPRLIIELDGVRSSVATMLTHRNDEINNLILKSLDEQLTQEWVIAEINTSVQKCLTKAIEDVASNWELKNAITNLIGNAINEMVKVKQ